ncbi:hypothetical protein Q3G72_022706 [Acer saccharum]|nr:hypothetical protein Q3G72_022706 [Acer saccharum]
MKEKDFSILPHQKEEMIYTNTIRRSEELFWRTALSLGDVDFIYVLSFYLLLPMVCDLNHKLKHNHSPFHKMRGYFQKQRAVAFMLPSQETNQRRCIRSIKCSNRARGFGICWLQRHLYTLQAPQLKCPRIFDQ